MANRSIRHLMIVLFSHISIRNTFSIIAEYHITKYIWLGCFIITGCSFSSIYTSITRAQPQKDFLNLVLILNAKPDSVMSDNFNRAIDQECIIMISTPILHTDYSTFIKLTDTSKWRIYCDSEKYFALCIPSSDKRSLSKLGFNERIWGNQIPANMIESVINNDKTRFKPIDNKWIKNFSNLWASGLAKNIYLTGHGLTNEQIAGIPLEQYKEFLRILTTIDTQFLWISTCYVGGINSQLMQQSIEQPAAILSQSIDESFRPASIGKLFESKNGLPSFIIVVESIGEMVSFAVNTVNIKQLLATVTDFFNQPHPPFYLGKSIKSNALKLPAAAKKIRLTDVINSYFDSTPPMINNLPSIYIPGTGFFRAVDCDKELIVTALELKRYRIQENITMQILSHQNIVSQQQIKDSKKVNELGKQSQMLKKEQSPLSPENNGIPLIIDSQLTKTILIYPNDLHDLLLDIRGATTPTCVSKITGNAQHILGGIRTKKEFNTIIESFISGLFGPYGYNSEQMQTWFIQNVTCRTKTDNPEYIKGLAIYYRNYMSQGRELQKATIIYSKDGKYYAIKDFSSSNLQQISQQEYIQLMNYFATKTKPTDKALYMSSAGMENSTTQAEAFKTFMVSIGISQEQINQNTTKTPSCLLNMP